MADVILTRFQSPVAEVATTNRIAIEVLQSAFTPIAKLRPVLDFLRASGRNGVRSRMVSLQPREFRVAGLIGAAGMADARSICENLQKSQLSYGTVEFTPSVGSSIKLEDVQMAQVYVEPINATLRGSGTTWTATVQVDCMMIAVGGAAI